MLSNLIYSVPIAQLPLADAGQLLLVTGIAFAVITLIASTYRFHRLIQLDESALPTTADCNDFFFIQVTRYLSKINRRSAGFGLVIIQFQAETEDRRGVQEKFLAAMQRYIREDSDKACLFREDCLGLIVDTEEELIEATIKRLAADIDKAASAVSEISGWRAGSSSFPLHGVNSQVMIDTAWQAVETASFDTGQPIQMAPPPEEETPEADKKVPEELGELSKEDKNTALDPLTGVLKPAVIGSYMRKYLADLRHKKQPAALLCVGINRLDNLIELQGAPAADEVIAGVSQVIQKLTRNSDLIGRFDRESFLVLATCNLEEGEMIANRLREAVQREVFIAGGRRTKTSISIGITAYPEHGRLLRDLFRGAHRALEIVHEWNTTACLVYDPAQHSKKAEPLHEARR